MNLKKTLFAITIMILVACIKILNQQQIDYYFFH